MTVIPDEFHGYSVVDDYGRILAGGFQTNGSAWRWIDRQNGEPISRSEDVAEWIWAKTLDA